MNTYTDVSRAPVIDGPQEFVADTDKYREGPIARKIERRTARLPSDLFLWVAGGAVALSLSLQIAGMMRGRKRTLFGRSTPSVPLAGFVGQWVPSLLLLGVYNKIVKVAGSDRAHR
jgi:hypothetical protein